MRCEITRDFLDDIMPRSFEIREVHAPSVSLHFVVGKPETAGRPQPKQNITTSDKAIPAPHVQNVGMPYFKPIDDGD